MRFTIFTFAILASSVAQASLFRRETPAECDTERARCLRQTGDVTQCQTNWTACMGTRTASLAPATTAAAVATTSTNTNTITSAATASGASATAASGSSNATGTSVTTGTATTGTASASSTALVATNGGSVNGPVFGLLAVVGAIALL